MSSWSADAAGFDTAAEGNGLKTWNLPADRAELEKLIGENKLWMEGAAASGARKDTGLRLEYYPGTKKKALRDEVTGSIAIS